MGVWLLPENSVGRSNKNSTTEVVMVKRLNELNNQPEIWLNNTRDVLKAVKAVEVLPLVTL